MDDKETPKVVPFPQATTPPYRDTKTEFSTPAPEDTTLWECKACDHIITESMEKTEADKSKVLPINLGGIMIYVCPNCFTMQMPEEVYNEILKKATSNIIT